jgi:biopolymer transport protein ExbD
LIASDSFLEPLQSPIVRTSLLFEYGNNDKKMTSEKQNELLEETKSTLKELAGESGTLSVRASTAKLFGKLVQAMEKLDDKNLESFVTDLEMTEVER